MSIIFGLFYKDKRPVSDELDVMYAGMKAFPHEQHAFAVQQNCGFGHMLTYNTPEAVHEVLPKWNEKEQLLFTAEGRLDNRADLFASLAIPDSEQKTIPDGDLMFKAYEKWGKDCADRLMGKWSFAAFHTDRQELFIARDKWDYSDVQYYEDDSVIAFSTSEQGLLPLSFVPQKIDDGKIAKLLVIWPGEYDKSFYKGIKRLLPSYTLSVTLQKTQLHRYWNYADVNVHYGLTLENYVDDLFDSLQKAVTARLRSYKPVTATLSGGMDSSTVCVLAASQLAQKGVRLQTYSHVPLFTPSGTLSEHQFGNERPFIEAIASYAGNIDPVFLNSETTSPLEGIKEGIRLYGEPFHGACNAYWMTDIFKTAARENFGTVLMGEFGNATTSWTGMEDSLCAEELFRRYGLKSVVKKKLLKPILYGKTPFAWLYKQALYGSRPWKNTSYCTRAFEKSLKITKGRMHKDGFDPTFRRYFSDPEKQAVTIFDYNVPRLPYGAALGCRTGLELRDPTGDPRVIESALSIPNELFLGPMNKWVLRTMMKDRLPDIVRLNEKKGKQSSDISSRLYAHRDEMEKEFEAMSNSDFKWIVDMERIKAEWEKLKADCGSYSPNDTAHLLRHVAAFEMFRHVQL